MSARKRKIGVVDPPDEDELNEFQCQSEKVARPAPAKDETSGGTATGSGENQNNQTNGSEEMHVSGQYITGKKVKYFCSTPSDF